MHGGAAFGDARDRALDGLAERDRRLAHALAAGVLRRRTELDRLIPSPANRVDARLHDILRLGAYQLRCLDRVPPHAAVSTSVELAREAVGEGAARYVNQALRRLAGVGSLDPGAGNSHPGWLVRRWRSAFGEADTQRLMAWNDAKPALTLQPARWDADTLSRRLQNAGIGVRDAPFGAGIQVTPLTSDSRLLAPQLPGFAEGAFIVQDPAHALVCRFAGVPRGARVYDACAAPGGKAVTLETAGARVVAGERRRDRVPRLVETAARAGVAIRVVCADLLAAPLGRHSCDAVLVDAPCTATGTMARHPDARWRLYPGAIARAAAGQRALLEAAAPLVRPGGLLVYATCSLEPEENHEVVDAFLSRHPEFARRPPLRGTVPEALVTPQGDFQSLPQRDGIDGAYAARLAR